MEAIVIIPARMAATRFPGKPLAKIAGLSMIGHCFLRAKMASLVKQVFVATCDDEIAEEVKRLKGQVIMTSSKHERASDRTAEALSQLKSSGNQDIDVVVMLQGDEPLINPNCIDKLIQHHEQYPHVSVFNLTQFIDNDDDFYNVNTVKLLTNLQSDVLVFSREAIPSPRLKGLLGFKPRKQLGVISFKSDALLDFYQLSPAPLEKIESIDMMRLLEYGRSIKEVLTDSFMQSVDTVEDAKKVEFYMKADPWYQQYKMTE
ncbi:MAG TPA: 3-deoxy-manno-octulosonate cytidylyltransferase [Gammaproteobacteria bacterium]|nr:3-deoxy-manno-octulosonate cytidylyltransferase [Gammaproteobacteria bacterium]